jgi:uncharacterized protein YndB with AHSA1/START domain
MLPSRFALVFALAFVCAAPASARDFEQVVGKAADGTRYYQDSLVIKAPVARLWGAFTDTAQYRAWGAKVSAIDFRIGGAIEASYDPAGHLGDPQNIKNQIIAYIPDRLLVFRNVQAPDRLPGKRAYGDTVKTLEFTALSPDTTRVTVSGMGFGQGADFDALYAFFSDGDGQMLTILKRAMEPH